MEEIVIPDLDDEDDFSLPSLGFGAATNSSSSSALDTDPYTHRTAPSASSDASFGGSASKFGSSYASTTPSRPPLAKNYSTSAAMGGTGSFGVPIDSGDRKMGKFSNGSSTSLAQPPPLSTSAGMGGLFGGRKGSLASLKNAFKSSANTIASPVPPVPQLDRQAPGYPALRNPFSRFDSPASPTTTAFNPRRAGSTSTTALPAPSAYHGERKQSVATTHSSQRSHGGRSATSQGSSSFRAEDHPLPALPRIPTRSTPSRAGRQGSDASMFAFTRRGNSIGTVDDLDMTSALPEALRLVFREFCDAANSKIQKILARPLNSHISLPAFLESGLDTSFDALVTSLAHCGKAHSRRVLDILTNWCRAQCEAIQASEVRAHLSRSMGLQMRVEDAATLLGGRKSSAAKYIYVRALIELVGCTPRDALTGDVGVNIEQTAFNLYRDKPDTQYPHRKAVSVLVVDLLGQLSNYRFLTVSDRFNRELAALVSAPAAKDTEGKVEHLLKGMRSLKLKVYPEDELETSADFLQSLASFFANAHGNTLKCAYAELLTYLLHPVVETATAEVNHPIWSKAVAVILSRAIAMASKPRYWPVTFPLVVVALAVSPREVFMEHFQSSVEGLVPKYKDRATKSIAMNSFIRLLWVYLNRCPESSTSTRKRLDNLLRIYFPPNSTSLFPTELPLEPFIAIVHYVMERQFDYGEEMVMDALRDCTRGDAIYPDRAIVAVQAMLYTLCANEQERLAPWPKSAEFNAFDLEFESTGDVFTGNNSEVTQFLGKCGPILLSVLQSCDRAVGALLLSSDGVTISAQSSSASWEGSAESVTQKHGDVYVTYAARNGPTLRLLASILGALPRCLPADGSIASILCRATFSADPAVCEAASGAIRRVPQDSAQTAALVDAYRQFIFDTRHVFRDSFVSARLLDSQLVRAVRLWLDILQTQVHQHRAAEEPPLDPAVLSRIEACGLFLLCSTSVALRRLAEPVFAAARDLAGQARRPSAAFRYSRIVVDQNHLTYASVHQVFDATMEEVDLSVLRRLPSLTSNDRHRLDIITAKDRAKLAQRIAESDNAKDTTLWLAFFPSFINRVAEHLPAPVAELRSLVGTTVVRLQPHIVAIANRGVKQYSARSSSDTAALADQWRLYLSTMCTTMPVNSGGSAVPPSTPPVRGGKDVVLTLDAISTPVIFSYLLGLLACDDRRFQDAAVYAMGSIRIVSFRPLSEMLLNFVRRLADGYKTSTPRGAPVTGTIAASASPSARHQHGQMWTAAAHVFRLISPLILDARSTLHHANLSSMISFVKITHTLLADRAVQEDYDLQSLRRWFCVVVENLTNALGRLQEGDRFLGDEARGAIFKLCYEWCSVGRRPDVAKARESHTLQAAADSYRGDRDRAQYLDDLQAKTKLLSAAAAEAMAGLCQGKVISAAAATPEQQASDHIVEPLTVLRWIRGMFTSSQLAHHETGRKALHALIKYNWAVHRLADEVLHQSFGEGEQFSLDSSFFGVVADAIGEHTLELPAEQLACLSLSKLGHPVADVRQRAFQLSLWLFAEPQDRLAVGAQLLPAVGSSAPNVYRQAQREMATRLADLMPDLALSFLAESATRLSQLEAPRRQATLSILPAWLAVLELEADTSDLSPDEVALEHHALSNLVYIAIRFSDDHLDDVREIFTAFAGSGRSRNTTALVKFLFEQGSKRRSAEFVAHAQQIMACLAQSPAGDLIFDEICGFVQPSDMATTASADVPPSPMTSLANLDTIIAAPSSRSQSFSQGQMALFFAGELLPHRLNDVSFACRMPTLLHVAFIHCDDPSPAIRDQAQTVLFQVLRAWICDTSNVAEPERAAAWASAELKTTTLARARPTLFWKVDDSGGPGTMFHAPTKMSTLVNKILGIVQFLQPRLRQQWGELALTWATSCPIRHLACRSFQAFRILGPRPSPRMISDTLARLSSTIASAAPEIQTFNAEVIRTFAAVVQSLTALDIAAYPQIFWCSMACLTTPYESEFNEAIDLLSHVLDKTNLADTNVVRQLVSFRPVDWVGPPPHLQALLLIGLRSSKTDLMTFDVLRRLTSVENGELIDASADRLTHGFVAALPWMLHSTDLGEPNEELASMALDLADIAEPESGMARLLTSFARARFRSKDDFIRQAVALLRDSMAGHGLEVVTLLLGFVLNSNDWVREKSMQILKLVLALPEARGPLATHSHELLQPLLRLVSTKHGSQALEVLDIASQHVPAVEQALGGGDIFGPISESGWSVPNAKERSEVTKGNVHAVFNTCAQETRAASAHFSVVQFTDLRPGGGRPPGVGGWGRNPSQISLDIPSPPPISADASMGDLVGALHSLNQFFDDGLDPSISGTPASPLITTSSSSAGHGGYGHSSHGHGGGGYGYGYGHAPKLSDSMSERRVRAVLARGGARTPSISSPLYESEGGDGAVIVGRNRPRVDADIDTNPSFYAHGHHGPRHPTHSHTVSETLTSTDSITSSVDEGVNGDDGEIVLRGDNARSENEVDSDGVDGAGRALGIGVYSRRPLAIFDPNGTTPGPGLVSATDRVGHFTNPSVSSDSEFGGPSEHVFGLEEDGDRTTTSIATSVGGERGERGGERGLLGTPMMMRRAARLEMLNQSRTPSPSR